MCICVHVYSFIHFSYKCYSRILLNIFSKFWNLKMTLSQNSTPKKIKSIDTIDITIYSSFYTPGIFFTIFCLFKVFQDNIIYYDATNYLYMWTNLELLLEFLNIRKISLFFFSLSMYSYTIRTHIIFLFLFFVFHVSFSFFYFVYHFSSMHHKTWPIYSHIINYILLITSFALLYL